MDPKDDNTGLEAGSDQALWKLLGHARQVEASPYFTRRVLRDLDAGVPLADERRSGWLEWLRPGWRLAGSAAGVAVAAVFLGLHTFSSIPVAQPPPVTERAQAVLPAPAPAVAAAPETSPAAVEVPDDVSPQDVDVIADLDNLVAREETKVWTDDSSRF